jgi:hypothetical protein
MLHIKDDICKRDNQHTYNINTYCLSTVTVVTRMRLSVARLVTNNLRKELLFIYHLIVEISNPVCYEETAEC